MDNSSFIVCACVREVLIPSPGSIRDKCAQCGTEIWISPAGRLTVERSPELKPTCRDCTVNTVGNDEQLKALAAPKQT